MNNIDEKRAIELVMRLMAIPGKSCEESLIAQSVVAELEQLGIPSTCITFDNAHQRTPQPGQVGNLIAKLPGDRRLPRIMLSAHLDTVPICVGCVPKRRGQVIYSANRETGLGADDRAGVAAVLTSLRHVLQMPQRPPITACFFVQEEIGLQGSRHLSVNKLGRPSMALNFDGGNPYKLTLGATGGERIWIRLLGIPAHAGLAPQTGASAIEAAGLAIAALHKGRWLGAVRKGRRTGTSNIGIIRGGLATNVVTELVEIAAEARSHDRAMRTEIAEAIQSAFHQAASQVVNDQGQAVRANVERRVDYDSFLLDPNSPIVAVTQRAIESLGMQPEQGVTNGGIDANWLVEHGIPTVTLGCGQRHVHTNQEQLDIPDYLAACKIALRVLTHAA
ncbi:MAG: M20/M25/M40 family metallo-hydrolase [Pirellulaceae bacterium]|nr:M20/M25/M40 family metallo-hydrolase [Pirellulaceae bacterium]